MYTRQPADGAFLDVNAEFTGTIVQQDVRVTPIEVGPIGTDAGEIKEMMPGGAPTLRPQLSRVHRASELNIVLDYDVEFPDTWASSPITTTLQLSVDASEWETVRASSETFEGPSDNVDGDPVGYVSHMRLQAVVDPATLVIWPAEKIQATVRARALVQRGAGAGTPIVISEDDGTAAIILQEIR